MPRNRSEKPPAVTPGMVAYLCAFLGVRDYRALDPSTFGLSWDFLDRRRTTAWVALPDAQKVVVRQMGMNQRRSIVDATQSK